jgi:hypothetical protein
VRAIFGPGYRDHHGYNHNQGNAGATGLKANAGAGGEKYMK